MSIKQRDVDDIVVEFIQNFTKLPLDGEAHRELVRIIESERSNAQPRKKVLPTIAEMSGLVHDFTNGKSMKEYMEELSDE